MSRPMINHRGPLFSELLADVLSGLKRVFETENQIVTYTSSGTGGMESALANLISPGDQVVACITGSFGERFAAIAAVYGAQVTKLEVEWGQSISPPDLEEVLAANPEAEIVLITHSETSTGVANPLRELAEVCTLANRLLVVDGISSVGSMPTKVDEWGIDVMITASQKSFMSPPGLAFLSISPRAWERASRVSTTSLYFDWLPQLKAQQSGSTIFTPAISTFYAVQEGLQMLFEEGLEEVYRRHSRIARALGRGLEALDFELLAPEGNRSPVVTAALPPEGVDLARLLSQLSDRYGVMLAGGYGKLKGRIIRVGHLGAVSEADMVQVLWSIEEVLREEGQGDKLGVGVAAFTRSLADSLEVKMGQSIGTPSLNPSPQGGGI